MTLSAFMMLIASVVASAIGQFCLKIGALKLGKFESDNLFGMVMMMATNWHIIGGLVCYALGVVAYILLLNQVSLSVASPAMTLSYVIGIMMGVMFFKETLHFPQYVAIAMILAGVVLLTQGKVPHA
jgi:multidrug transporter EmrE-like cation transporter